MKLDTPAIELGLVQPGQTPSGGLGYETLKARGNEGGGLCLIRGAFRQTGGGRASTSIVPSLFSLRWPHIPAQANQSIRL